LYCYYYSVMYVTVMPVSAYMALAFVFGFIQINWWWYFLGPVNHRRLCCSAVRGNVVVGWFVLWHQYSEAECSSRIQAHQWRTVCSDISVGSRRAS